MRSTVTCYRRKQARARSPCEIPAHSLHICSERTRNDRKRSTYLRNCCVGCPITTHYTTMNAACAIVVTLHHQHVRDKVLLCDECSRSGSGFLTESNRPGSLHARKMQSPWPATALASRFAAQYRMILC